MTIEIEKQRGNYVLRPNQLLTGTYVESLAVKLNGFDMIEIGLSYFAHNLAPLGVKALLKVQFSPDGVRYFDHAMSQDVFPAAPNSSVIRSIIYAREFEFFGKPNVTVTAWHNLRTAARYLKVAVMEMNNAGNFGNLLVACRAADA